MTATRIRVTLAALGALLLAGCTAAPLAAAGSTVATVPSTSAVVTSPAAVSPAKPKPIVTPKPTVKPRPTPTVTSKPSVTAKPTSQPTPTVTPEISKAAAPRPAATAQAAVLPVAGATGIATQVLTVTAASSSATRATLQAWHKTASGWARTGAAVPAWLGYGGMTTHASENFNGTPIGSFSLTHAFGNNADPGTKLPYFRADEDDWWSGDSNAPGYNTHQHCAQASCPFDTATSENLHDASWVYGYAVVIDYNTPAQPGRGSAFFLHVTENKPTQGCVSIARASLVRILGWLDPAQHPRILMGIG